MSAFRRCAIHSSQMISLEQDQDNEAEPREEEIHHT
jgi:hypothetical protein